MHRSHITMNLLRNDVLAFGNTFHRPDDPLLDYAISIVSDQYRLPQRQKLIHLNEVWQEDLPIWSASPGLPYVQRPGYKTKADVRSDQQEMNNIRWFWHSVKTRQKKMIAPDCCAFVRAHLAPPGEEKNRAVWGYPISVVVAEAMFALPLIEAYKSGSYPIGYGYETANGGTRRILKEFAGYHHYYCLDFKSFDKTIPKWLVYAAFHVLEQNLDFTSYRGYGTTNVRGTLTQWEYIKDYFVNTPIRLPNGERYRKSGGVASGSYFTQLIDSVVNSILINYMHLSLFDGLPLRCKVFGDDSIFATHMKISLEEISEFFQRFFSRCHHQ